MVRECEDVEALLAATGARLVFGHSSGALVALQAALTLPQVDKIAVYEPQLSEHGSIPTSWIPRFDREVALGKPAAALVTFVKADNLVPAYLPRWLLVPLQRFDGLLVEEMDSSLQTFAGMSAEVLLMGGRRSPAFLHEILDALEGTFPRVHRVEFKGVGHEAPHDRGSPERVGEELRAFFADALLDG